MSTDRPAARRAHPRTIDSVPTPRSGVPTAGFGISALSAREDAAAVTTDEPERRSRAVTVAGALLLVLAVVAAVVAFRIMVPSTPIASADATPLVESTEIREQPGSIVGFGQPHTYGDGLEVAVNPAQRYEPSNNATGVDQGVAVKLQVVVTNRTDEPFRPNTLQIAATSAGQPGVAVWDPDQGIALTGPDMSIPAGSTISFNVAFAVADPADIQLELTPALFGYGATVVRVS